MNKYKLLIFDIDGTLLESHAGIISAIYKALAMHELKWPEDKLPIRNIIGLSIKKVFEKVFPKYNDLQINELVDDFREEYAKEENIFNASIYNNEYETLEKLKKLGYKLVIVTFKRDDLTQMIFKHFHFDKYFKYALGTDKNGKISKTDLIIKAFNKERVSPSETLYIGDTLSDYKQSCQAGVNFIGARYGYGFKNIEEIKIYNNIKFIDKFDNILEML